MIVPVPVPLFINEGLARELEMAEAHDALECANAMNALRPEVQATVLAAAGGYAVFVGDGSPLTHALGVGMNGPVNEKQLLQVEHFFQSRGTSVQIDVCPLADPSVLPLLAQCGYRPAELQNVMVRRLTPDDPLPELPGVTVRSAAMNEDVLWASTLGRGFFEHEPLPTAELEIGMVLFHMGSAHCYFAEVESVVAGGGAYTTHDRLASLFGDATLPASRRKGAQSALILHRLRRAVAEGCSLATAGVLPGSQSQFNYQRCGFQIAYTKLVVSK